MERPTLRVAGIARYVLAVVFVAVAATVRWALPSLLGPTPDLPFFVAIVSAAAVGGFGPGLLASLTAAVCVDLLFVEPVGQLTLGSEDLARLAIFTATGGGVSVIAEQMRAAKRKAEEILESITDGFVALDADTRFTYVNREAEHLLGRARRELLGRTTQEAVPEAIRSAFGKAYQQVETGPQPVRFEAYYAPRDAWYEVYVHRLGQGLTVYFHDVTRRRRDEEARRESEERFKKLFESMGEGVALCEMIFDEAGKPADFRYVDVNPAFTTMTGLPVERVVGRRVREVIPSIEPSWIEAYGQVVETGQSVRIAQEVSELGRLFDVHAFRTAPGRFAAVFMDVTERERAEKEREELLARERAAREKAETATEMRERIMAVLSHDLRQPLGVIVTCAGLLARAGLDERQAKAVERIERGGKLIAAMIRDLLDFSAARSLGAVRVVPAPANLADLCSRAVEDARLVFSDRAIDLRAEGDLSGEWDSDRLLQVLSNLLTNALQHGDERATVSVTATGTADGKVLLEVHNEGKPIPTDLLPVLFEPFHPGRIDRARGLGLGLYIVREIVRAHGGGVDVTSTPNQGTTFKVELPRVTSRSARA